MFTGIIETIGQIQSIDIQGTNSIFKISSPLSRELRVDQSLSHNGVCLTVEAIQDDTHQVTAIEETLNKTDLGHWKTGDLINLERCLVMNGRLDGHIVQGHVDSTAACTDRIERGGSWEFSFSFPAKFGALVIEKGSICLNGISLTVFNVKKKHFTVAIIPYTFEHTNIKKIFPGHRVNIEFDMIGKYVSRIKDLQAR
jgi:riboflavin synthase